MATNIVHSPVKFAKKLILIKISIHVATAFTGTNTKHLAGRKASQVLTLVIKVTTTPTKPKAIEKYAMLRLKGIWAHNIRNRKLNLRFLIESMNSLITPAGMLVNVWACSLR